MAGHWVYDWQDFTGGILLQILLEFGLARVRTWTVERLLEEIIIWRAANNFPIHSVWVDEDSDDEPPTPPASPE